MFIMSLLSSITAFFSFLFCYIVYRGSSSLRKRRAYLLMAGSLGIWATIATITFITRDHDEFIRLFRLGTVFQHMHFASMLHMAFAMTDFLPRHKLKVALIYLPWALALLFFLIDPGVTDNFILLDGRWQFNHKIDSAAFALMKVAWLAGIAVATALYLKRARTAAMRSEQCFFRLLAVSVITVCVLIYIEVLILPLLFAIPSRGMVIVFKLLWLLFLAFALDYYRQLIPDRLDKVALTSFPGYAVIVLDSQLHIYCMNRQAEKLFDIEADDFKGRSVGSLSANGRDFDQDLSRIIGSGNESVSGIISITSVSGNSNLLLDIRLSRLKNADSVLLGFILIVHSLQGSYGFSGFDQLSKRELEIIGEIVSGYSNGRIAERLYISERTVKTHITHIFQKLDIQNRIQLYELLRRHNCISRQNADKQFFLAGDVHN